MIRSLVVAPFFSHESVASRPLFVSEVLARLGPVDIVTTDFDHQRKARKSDTPFVGAGRTVRHVRTPAYRHNVSVARFASHVVFSVRAWRAVWRHRHDYDVVYVTLPLNLLALLCFLSFSAQVRIADIVDIWPDVLPFSRRARQFLFPLFALWRRAFSAAVGRADLLLTVSDHFLAESMPAFRGGPESAKRVYICHRRLAAVPRVDDGRLTIAYVGNIGHLYDLETLVEAMAGRGATAHLLLVGDGDRAAWLCEALARRQVSYEYFGVVFDDAALAAILGRADLGFNGYVNTSATFSYKAATYLAAGLPLLNSMSGDLYDIVQQQRIGFNYRAGDVMSLARCLDAATPSHLAELHRHAENFFASALESREVSSDLEQWLRSRIPSVQ